MIFGLCLKGVVFQWRVQLHFSNDVLDHPFIVHWFKFCYVVIVSLNKNTKYTCVCALLKALHLKQLSVIMKLKIISYLRGYITSMYFCLFWFNDVFSTLIRVNQGGQYLIRLYHGGQSLIRLNHGGQSLIRLCHGGQFLIRLYHGGQSLIRLYQGGQSLIRLNHGGQSLIMLYHGGQSLIRLYHGG